jgi:hypothetical protein
MTTPYVYLSSQTTKEKIETPQDTFNMYFWGGVVIVLLLTGVVLLVLYGLQPSADSGDEPSLRSLPTASVLTTQLPLYLGSTQFSDPPEDV